jgi:hypothetical protein
MNPFEMVLGIVIVVMIATVLKARYKAVGPSAAGSDDSESRRLKEEVRALRERVQVLERIATDKESQLDREIERLRDR